MAIFLAFGNDAVSGHHDIYSHQTTLLCKASTWKNLAIDLNESKTFQWIVACEISHHYGYLDGFFHPPDHMW